MEEGACPAPSIPFEGEGYQEVINWSFAPIRYAR